MDSNSQKMTKQEEEATAARKAVTAALIKDPVSVRIMQDAGDASKRKREQLGGKQRSASREGEDKEKKSDKTVANGSANGTTANSKPQG